MTNPDLAGAPALSTLRRLLQRSVLAYGRIARGMTLGVRAMLLDGDRVLLVRHTYVPGWYLPGGGVERGETVFDAVEREAREEAGAVLTAPPELFGVYRNAAASRSDHVAMFVCRAWRQPSPPARSLEIVEWGLFQVADLPAEATAATRARIAEVLAARSPSRDW